MSIIAALRSAARTSGASSRRDFLNPQSNGTAQPTSDPLLAISNGLLSTSTSALARMGTIVDYVPHVRSYRVQQEAGGPLIQCTRLLQGNTQPLGVSDGDTFQPGTVVFFLKHSQAGYGVILGAMPFVETDGRRTRSDWTSPGGRCGIAADPAHLAGFQLGGKDTGGGITAWTARATMDSTGVGEFSRISETGINLHMDSYMLQARVDEYCGMWLFYWDQLCRIAGYNFQQWTGGSVLESFNDESEHFWYHGVAVYPWEQLGQYHEPVPTFTKNTASDVQLKKQHLGYVEPSQQSIQPFHRTQVWMGYLGQGRKELQIAPPPDGYVQDYNNSTEKLIGLAEHNVFMDGQIANRTARGFTIAKRPLIPVPKQKRLPADKLGDKADNYKASGKLGEGKEHKLYAEPTPPSEHASQARIASIEDLHAYLFNWKGAHQFHYHAKDFELPEESELTDLTTNQTIPEFNDLKQKPYLDPPQPVNVKVDHRYTTQVYPNQSYFNMLPDGGLLFGDGWGSEIRMSGGNIKVACAGDITFEAGRTIVQWGGKDIVLRAKGSVDVTATEKDVRLKAEHNVQILAANGGGDYGLLLESRADGEGYNFDQPGEQTKAAGIMLKSKSAPVVTWADNLYMRSTGGNIVLDANKGTGDLITYAGNISNYISGTTTDYFGTEGSISAANVFSASQTIIDSALFVFGPIVNSGPHVMSGNLLITGGHVYSEAGDKNVRPLEGIGLTTASSTIKAREDAASKAEQRGGTKFKSDIQDPWYELNKAGSDAVIKNAQCSLRVLADYGTDDFVLFESRWAQMARLGNKTTDKWTEKAVTFGNQETYPYPGKEHYKDSSYWLTTPRLYDIQTGRSKDRGDLYETASLASPTAKPLDGQYPVVG